MGKCINDPLISIVVLNYNRPTLGAQVLRCLEAQEKKNFEVILLNNSSEVPIPKEVINSFTFPIVQVDSSKKFHNELLNAAVHLCSGKLILPFFADDDFLLPNATKIIETIFETNSEVECLSLGTAKFDLTKNNLIFEPEGDNAYTGVVFSFIAKEVASGYFSNWSIGETKPHPLKVCGHPSATVVTKKLIERTIKRQGEIFIGPFGDVGMLGFLFSTKHLYKVDLPLVLLGMNHPQDSALMRQYYGEERSMKEKTTRARWNKHAAFLQNSPMKGITHINLATENHLQILKLNGYDLSLPNDLRIEFFINHIAEILKDVPWDASSENDFNEALENLQNALVRERVSNKDEIIRHFITSKDTHVKNLKDTKELSVDNEPCNYDFVKMQAIIDDLMLQVSKSLPDKLHFTKPPKTIDFVKGHL